MNLCFELAARFVLRDPSWSLAHGCIEVHGAKLAHAWCVRDDGVAYDPVHDETKPAAGAGVVERTYCAAEIAEMTAATGTFGPWHATAGSYVGRSGRLVWRANITEHLAP